MEKGGGVHCILLRKSTGINLAMAQSFFKENKGGGVVRVGWRVNHPTLCSSSPQRKYTLWRHIPVQPGNNSSQEQKKCKINYVVGNSDFIYDVRSYHIIVLFHTCYNSCFQQATRMCSVLFSQQTCTHIYLNLSSITSGERMVFSCASAFTNYFDKLYITFSSMM